jgi:SAM-dependent methyltransferase
MTHITHKDAPPGKVGLVMHAAALYDVVVWLLTLGREPAFREKLLQFARLQPGETVLDVGCGTGSLAIAAKRQVGATGRVYGIDASPEMIARAAKKARKIGVEIALQEQPRPEVAVSRCAVRCGPEHDDASSLAPQRPRGLCPRDKPGSEARRAGPCR